MDDFSVTIAEPVSENAIVLTTAESEKKIEEALQRAFSQYDPENKMYSAVLNPNTSQPNITLEDLTSIAADAQSNLTSLQNANKIITRYVNLDESIGMIATTISSNVNTDMRLSYKNVEGGTKKQNTLARAKKIIADFNEQIDVRRFIRESIVTTWLEGNYICNIRYDGKSNWVLDRWPLGIAELSPYTQSGKPVVQINMQELKTALQKTILKNKRGKALYFENTLKEIEANFGPEVVQAYKDNENYCRLDTNYTGVARVNNFGGLYGLSPVFRAIPSALALETLRNADMAMAEAKTKTILVQRLRKEMLAGDSKVKQYEQTAWAHNNLMRGFKQGTVVVTTPPTVEVVEYVYPKNEEISSDKQDVYTKKILSSLGVQFLSGTDDVSTTVAKLSFSVLLNQINAIGEQVERILENFYRTVLTVNNIDPNVYLPTVRIIDSEMLDAGARTELAKLLLSTFASSRRTAFDVVGINLDDEVIRRQEENDADYNSIFTPYPTSYVISGDSEDEGGRPPDADSNDEDKQALDEELNK